MPDTLDDLVNSIAGSAPEQKPAQPQNLSDLVNSIAGQPASQQQPNNDAGIQAAAQKAVLAEPPADDPDGASINGMKPSEFQREQAYYNYVVGNGEPNGDEKAKFNNYYDSFRTQQKAAGNNANWMQQRQAINAPGDLTPQEKAQQFLQDNPNPGFLRDAGSVVQGLARGGIGVAARAGQKIAELFKAGGTPSDEGINAGKDIADELNRDQAAQNSALSGDEANNGNVSAFVHRNVRALADGLVKTATLGPGALAAYGAEAENQAETEADDAGLTGAKKAAYVTGKTAVATAMAHVLGNAFGGNAEGEVAKDTVLSVLKGAVKNTPALAGTNFANMAIDKLSGVDDSKLSFNDVTKTLGDSFVQALGFEGAGAANRAANAPGLDIKTVQDHAVEFVKNNPEAAAELAKKDSLSRKDMQDLGIIQRMSATQRTAFLDQVKTELLNQPEAQTEAQPRDYNKLDLSQMSPRDIIAAVPPTDKPVSKMTPNELIANAYRSPIEGMPLPNKTAMKEALRANPDATHINIDGDGLKYINDNVGHEAGNELLRSFGMVLHDEGLDGYHISGDEFKVLSNDPEGDRQKVQAALDRLQNATLIYELPDGRRFEHAGAGFSFGVGDNDASAEEQLKQHKSARESSGERAGRGEKPAGLVGFPAEGGQADGQPAPTDQSGRLIAERRQPSGRAEPISSGEQATSGGTELPAGQQAVQSQQPQSIQPGQGNPAEAEHATAGETARGPGAAPSESLSRKELEDLSPLEIRKRLADEFGLKSTGSKTKDIERYLKAAGEAELGAQFGPGANFSAKDFSDAGEALKRTMGHLWNSVVGRSVPNLQKMDRRTSELLVEHAASSVAAKPTADAMYARVFGDDAKLANKTMAVLTEDNLRGIADQHNTNQNPTAAQNVKSLVGPNGVWKTEADYQRDAHSPDVQAAIQKWKQVVNPWMDQQYATTKGLANTHGLPTRGREFDARINLLANDHVPNSGGPASGGGNPDNPRRNWNPFRKKATGAAENGYSTDAQAVLENTVNNVISKSTRLRAIDAMVKNGVAQFSVPGTPPPATLKGDPVAHFAVDIPTATGLEKKEMYFPKSIEGEVRQALNTDVRGEPNGILKAVNAAQMLGITDATAHSANIIRGITQAPGGSGVLQELTQRGIPGVKLVDTIVRLASKASELSKDTPEIQQKVADLARIGALRPEHEGGGKTAQFLGGLDKTGRLVMNDLYDSLVKRGLKPDNDTERREFINQLGQYNSRLQSKWVAMLKDWGVSPFIVAGTTFNRMGAKALVGGHGGEASSPGAEAQLRTTQIMRNLLIPAVTGAAMTYLLTGKPTSPGVPLGAVDTGKKDEKGNPIYVDLLDVARRGLNVTGTGKVAEGLMQGREPGMIADSAARDIVNNNLHPFAGPGAKAAVEAITGQKMGVGLGPTGPAAPVGGNQALQNLKNAGNDINPLLGGVVSPDEGKTRKDALADAGTGAVKTLLGIKSGKAPLSPAAELAQAYYRRQVGDKQYDEEEQKAHNIKKQIESDVRGGMSRDEAIKKAVASGLVTEKEALKAAKSGDLDRGDSIFKQLKAEDAQQVLAKANADEHSRWQPMMDQKIANLMKPLAQAIPVIASKKEEWKANVNSAIERAQKMGLTKDQVRQAYVSHLNVKSDATRQADLQRFNTQLNARWQEQTAVAQP